MVVTITFKQFDLQMENSPNKEVERFQNCIIKCYVCLVNQSEKRFCLAKVSIDARLGVSTSFLVGSSPGWNRQLGP